MHQFFVESTLAKPSKVWIEGEDAHHIERVLRMRIGEEVLIVINRESQWLGEIDLITEGHVEVRLMAQQEGSAKQTIRVILYQGVPKSDKMDWIVQKATELGVAEICPIQMKRSVSRIDKLDKAEKKQKRWQRIADEAAKQSKRLTIPTVKLPMGFSEMVKEIPEDVQVLVAYEDEKKQGLHTQLKTLDQTKPIAVIIGPEGGFEESEIQMLRDNGARIVGLGPRILRTETASLAFIAILQYECGDFL